MEKLIVRPDSGRLGPTLHGLTLAAEPPIPEGRSRRRLARLSADSRWQRNRRAGDGETQGKL